MDKNTLKKRRGRLGMTQADLAAELGVAPNTVSRYETGSLPVPAHMNLVLEALEKRHIEDMQKPIREGK
jgi:transcriptional regulator with XRE-family HTH domain